MDWENTDTTLSAPHGSIRECAYWLWGILDDIDTAGDALEFDSEFRKYIATAVRRRFLCAASDPDRYELVWEHD